MGETDAQKDLYEWNARVQITTWGNRAAADDGGLHDYAHKEWNGLLQDFYYMRWKTFFDELNSRLNGNTPKEIDFYALEEDRKSTRLNSSHANISYAVFCLKKKNEFA